MKSDIIKKYTKRYFIFLLGLYIMALSVRISVSVSFGTSPISTLPNVFSYKFENISLGVIMFAWNMLLLLSQILILRKKFNPVQLLQIPFSFVFSAMLDFNEFLLRNVIANGLALRILLLAISCIMLGFSVFLTVRAGVVMNSGEGIVKAIADTTKIEFGYLKVILDVAYVLIGVALSLAFFGEIKGVGAGTVFLAVCTGFVVKFFTKLLGSKVDAFCKK